MQLDRLLSSQCTVLRKGWSPSGVNATYYIRRWGWRGKTNRDAAGLQIPARIAPSPVFRSRVATLVNVDECPLGRSGARTLPVKIITRVTDACARILKCLRVFCGNQVGPSILLKAWKGWFSLIDLISHQLHTIVLCKQRQIEIFRVSFMAPIWPQWPINDNQFIVLFG